MRKGGTVTENHPAGRLKALVRLGGEERRGKGSHRVVNMNGYNLSVPAGILKIGLLKRLIKLSGRTEIEFLENV